MNRAEMVNSVAEKTGLTKKEAGNAIDAVFGSITESLAKGDNVKVLGFGSFEVRERKSRIGRNPKKPEETVKIAPTKSPFFKPGKLLKEAIK